MRKVRTGTVVRTKMDKTAVVQIVWKQRHRLYRKQMRRVARFHIHDPLSQCKLGDVVRIQEVRPISKTKRWRLLDILERHEVAEVRPIELESDAEVVVTSDPSEEPEELADRELMKDAAEPAGEEPDPADEEPDPADEEPEPADEEPETTDEEPEPADEEPEPAEEEPEPADEESEPADEEPEPAEEEPEPADEESEPAEEEPEPADEEPEPVDEEPEPADEDSKE